MSSNVKLPISSLLSNACSSFDNLLNRSSFVFFASSLYNFKASFKELSPLSIHEISNSFPRASIIGIILPVYTSLAIAV